MQRGGQLDLAKRFGEIFARPQGMRFADGCRIIAAGAHDDLQLWAMTQEFFEGIEPVQPGHFHIQQHHIGNNAGAHAINGIPATRHGFHRAVLHFKRAPEILLHACFVIHHQHYGCLEVRFACHGLKDPPEKGSTEHRGLHRRLDATRCAEPAGYGVASCRRNEEIGLGLRRPLRPCRRPGF
ncbi:MAG TPA: hypothetical protein VE994_01420 [Terriglobales bacterium]|nr:hypothetical protein [Terriglobales bacterium]